MCATSSGLAGGGPPRAKSGLVGVSSVQIEGREGGVRHERGGECLEVCNSMEGRERGSVLLVRNLILPKEFNTLRFENLLPCRRTRSLIQDRSKDLDILFGFSKKSRTAGLETCVLLLGRVLLERVAIQVVAHSQLAGFRVALVEGCEVGLGGGRGKHGGPFCVDTEGREDVLCKVVAQALTGDALEDYAGPVDVYLEYHL